MPFPDAVFLVTGCSSGLGRALAEQALEQGCRVVATARDPSTLADLASRHPGRVLVLPLDVTDADAVAGTVREAEHRFGRIDVVVNNAGYGYVGAIEEGEDEAVRAQFATNLFGPVALLKAVLPGMRARRSGHVVNIGSVGGLVCFPAVGYYHMTKFALEALSETLARELEPFGVGVTVVEPGAFRTEFRGGSMKQSGSRLPDYADTAGRARDAVLAGHGSQSNDPVLGARAILAVLRDPRPPLHLVLGADALELIRAKLASLSADLDRFEALTRSTAFAGR